MKNKQLGLYRVFFILTSIITLCGCNNYSADDTKMALLKKVNSQPTAIGKEKENELKTLKEVKGEVLSVKPVYDVAIIKGEKNTVVAYKVKHLHRFKMKKIEKEINQHLEKKFPKEDFVISSDYKIFLEVTELINDEKDPNFSDKKAQKKLKEIISLKKELT